MIDFVTQTWLFAATYGSGTYGDGTYNNGVTAATTASSGGGLVNTGTVIIGITTLACLLAFAALVIRFWKRKRAIHYLRSR